MNEQILSNADLRMATLTVEDEEGNREELGYAATVSEGKKIIQNDLASRMAKVESGDDSVLCPYEYHLWEIDAAGTQRIVASWLADDL